MAHHRFRSFVASRDLVAAGMAGACLAGLLMTGCGDDEPAANAAPTVALTASPPVGDTVSYQVRLEWSGEDRDGSIARYEVAVDPPAAFTEEEMAGKGSGLTVETLPGSSGDPDTTRVSKVAGGGTVSFDWIHESGTGRDFVFSTPDPDSVDVPGGKRPSGRFVGMHAVYVRAVDDDDAVSPPAKVAFTASTLAPSSRITSPAVAVDAIALSRNSVTVGWAGEDPDSRFPAKLPIGYLVKLVQVSSEGCCTPETPPESYLDDGLPWTRFEADSLEHAFAASYPNSYVLAFRAIDDNGAVEPFLEWGRNAVRLLPSRGGRPSIVFSCTGRNFELNGREGTFLAEIPQGLEVHTTVSCLAGYGLSCPDLRWGIDLTDPDSEEGWSAWTRETSLPALRFDEPGQHTLTLQVRDEVGATATAIVGFTVVEFVFDREILLVDDSFDEIFPSDSEHDAFWHGLFAANPDLAPGSLYEYESHGTNDRETETPLVPSLSEMARYRTVIWECRGTGYNAETALLHAAGRGTLLATYLEAGGQLWVGGRLTIGATHPDEEGLGSLAYPLSPAPGDFAWEFLKIRSRVGNEKAGTSEDALAQVVPYPGSTAGFESMIVDPTKLNLYQQANGGVIHSDAVLDPLLVNDLPGFRGELDSLFAYVAAGPLFRGTGSFLEGKPTGLRWRDPDPDPQHGRIQWFGFSLYYFRSEEVQATFDRAVSWFLEDPPAP